MKNEKTPSIQYAMHYLSRYPKSVAEMRIKLLEKGYDYSDVEETIQKLVDNNYLNDKAFVEAYMHSEVIRKGKPVYLIKTKMMSKQIDMELIQEVLDENEKEMIGGMKQAILKEIDKRKARGEDPIDIIQRLQRKGYDFALIQKTIEQRAAKRGQM